MASEGTQPGQTAGANQIIGDAQALWLNGMRSDVDPIALDDQSYPAATNVTADLGVISTRAPFRGIAHFPAGWPQAFKTVEDINGGKIMVAVIQGTIVVSKFPFNSWTIVDGVRMRVTARQCWITQATVNARTEQDGNIRVLDPYNIVVISDDFTRTVVLDTRDLTAAHQNPNPPVFGIPVCGPTKWQDYRLWAMTKNLVKGSNIREPDKYTEIRFISGGGNITLPRRGVGFGQPFAGVYGLLAFTDRETTGIQSGIENRDQWQSTKDFTKTLFPKIGMTASKSFTNHYGLSLWWSAGGMVTLNDAMQTYQNSELKIFDRPMAANKKYVAPDTTQVCATSHGRRILVSAPVHSPYNRETWLYDANNMDIKGWTGAWKGIHPIEWSTEVFSGVDRSFCLSIDDPANPIGGCTIWEIYSEPPTLCSPRWETSPPCRVEFGLFAVQKPTAQPRSFACARIELENLNGDVTVRAWMAPASTRVYRKIMEKHYVIGKPLRPYGELAGGVCALPLNPFDGCRSENRVAWTQNYDLDTDGTHEDQNERDDRAQGDRGYLVMVEMIGRGNIRQIRVFTNTSTEDFNGRPDEDNCYPTCISGTGAKQIDCSYLSRTREPLEDAVDALILLGGPPNALLWEDQRGFLLHMGDNGVTEPDNYLTYVDGLPDS